MYFILELKLVYSDLTNPNLQVSDITGWTGVTPVVYGCDNPDYEYYNLKFFGKYGLRQTASKTYSNLPPHWSVTA